MVIWGIVIGGMLLEIMNFVNRFLISKCLIELIRNGLFLLILMRVGNWGCFRSVKKIM